MNEKTKEIIIYRILLPILTGSIAAIIASIATNSTNTNFVIFIAGLAFMLSFLMFLMFSKKKVILRKVLLVDDNGKDLAEALYCLKSFIQKYEVDIAGDVKRARKLINEKRPDYAVIDLTFEDPNRLEGENNNKLEGIDIMKYILENEFETIIIPYTGTHFSEAEKTLENKLTDFGSNTIKNIKDNYIYKGEGNSILALLEKLKDLEKAKKTVL